MVKRWLARICAALVLAAAGSLAAAAVAATAAPPAAHWRVVLVAGDTAQPVFDNAIQAMRLWLTEHGVRDADIHRLAASAGPRDPAVEPATLARVLDRIAALHAQPGDGCFVFITSHGAPGRGIYLARDGEMLNPRELGSALSQGCAAAPTVVVVSGCYSGNFARVLAAPNRIVLTAARADRPSFGCAAERNYTVYDACLLGAMSHAATWRAVYDDTRGCVERHEHQLDELASYPQASFGAAMRGFPLQF